MASTDGKSLFVVGGFAGYELNDVHRFDLTTRTWDCPTCCRSAAIPLYSGLANDPRKPVWLSRGLSC